MVVETANKVRRGRILVTPSVWEQIGKPETSDAWQKALLLPERYKVERVEHPGKLFCIFVLSEAIPVSDAHISQVDIHPFYCRNENRQTYLDRIEISEWDGEHWQTVKVDKIA